MNLDKIISELRGERDRSIEQSARCAMVPARLARRGPRPTGGSGPSRGKDLTPAGRRRLSEAMKARWAARRFKTKKAARATTAAPKRGMSAASRKRISAALKKRWADKKTALARKPAGESARSE